jgi:hypothetical protein
MNEQETEQTRDLATEEIDEVTGGAGFDAKCTHDNWYAEWLYQNFKVCI